MEHISLTNFIFLLIKNPQKLLGFESLVRREANSRMDVNGTTQSTKMTTYVLHVEMVFQAPVFACDLARSYNCI